MATKRGNIKARNTTEAVLDLGTFRSDDGVEHRVVFGSSLDRGVVGTPDRPVHQPQQDVPAWAWEAAMRFRANQEHVSCGRITMGW